MSLDGMLRARKDLEMHHPATEEEAVYLLTPTAEQNDYFHRNKRRKDRKLEVYVSKLFTRRFNIISMICFTISMFFFFLWQVLGYERVLVSWLTAFRRSQSLQPPRCVDTPDRGYQCQPQISHYWGQYSPFFSIPSDISTDLPQTCTITFAQVLSRHGARDPTSSKTQVYNSTITKLKTNVRTFSGKYAFLSSFVYSLGADQLTLFGEQEMINSGITFYNRYKELARQSTPFIRSSGEARVVESAQNFSQGFHQAKTSEKVMDFVYPYPILVISEGDGFNNTCVQSAVVNVLADLQKSES